MYIHKTALFLYEHILQRLNWCYHTYSFCRLGIAGIGRYFGAHGSMSKKLRKDVKKEFQKLAWQAWLPPAFKDGN